LSQKKHSNSRGMHNFLASFERFEYSAGDALPE
jgi:hypothetical protein